MTVIFLLGMPGGGELFFIVLVIVMLFGAKKIPELARGLGKGMRELKNATGDIQREITESAGPISNLKDKMDVEKQVKDYLTSDPEENNSSLKDNSTSEENKIEDTEETGLGNTVKRGGPYDSLKKSDEE